MKIWKAHPAALAFPLMRGAAFEDLKKSILDRGQDFPGVTHEGKLLDGRNRQEAVRQLVAEKKLPPDTELKVVPFRGGSIAGFVRAANVERRHLSESQLAMIASRLLPLFRKEAKEKQRAAAKATNRSKKAGQKALSLVAPGHKAKRASERAAEASGGKVSARSVDRAEFIRKNDPALAKRVENDELTLKQAEKKIRHRAQVKQIQAYVPPAGKFQLITTDFSWNYDDKLDGSDAVRGGCPYPPMSVEEIVRFVEGPLAACADEVCLLGCWVTNPIMLDLKTWPVVQQVIEDQGFRPVKLNTWRKIEESGKPFTGLGNGQRNDSEQLVLFARGTVVYNELGEAHGRALQRTVFDAPIGEHSEKPQLAYTRLEGLVPYTSRLEMFARAPREGWVTSGAELLQPPGGVELAPPLPSSEPDVARPALPKHEEAAAEAVTPSFSLQGGPGSSEAAVSERSDLPAELECANCHVTFLSREILSKHANACGEAMSVVDAIATGAAIIEVAADRTAVLAEIHRLEMLKPKPGTPEALRVSRLHDALDAFRALKRQTREALVQPMPDFSGAAVGGETLPVNVPPVAPASVTAPPDDEIWF